MSEFFAGWVTDYSLSIDNLFIFVLIMTRFEVPARFRQQVLLVGIALALALRGIFIAVGAEIATRFTWVFYLFGAFLLYTAWKLLTADDDEDFRGAEPDEGAQAGPGEGGRRSRGELTHQERLRRCPGAWPRHHRRSRRRSAEHERETRSSSVEGHRCLPFSPARRPSCLSSVVVAARLTP